MACIAIWGAAVYSNTLRVPFVFDDLVYIRKNPILKDLNLADIISFAPSRWIGFFSFTINYYIGQWNTIGYHLVNLAIHIGSAVCCYSLFLLTLMTPRLRNQHNPDFRSTFALLAGLIFVTHPVQTEAVTYVWQRVESLAAFFYLFSLALYVKWRLEKDRKPKSSRAKGSACYGASCVLALMSAMTKETAMTLPAVIILYEIVFVGDFAKRFRHVMASVTPFLSLLVLVPVLAQQSPVVTRNFLYESPPVWSYMLTQTRVIATYLRLLVWPVEQNLDYDFPLSYSFLEPGVFFSVALILSIVILGLLFYRSSPLITFGTMWFFITLSPTSSVIPLPDVIFEHRLYLPLSGFAFVLMGLVASSKKPGWIVTVVMSIVLVLFSVATHRRNAVWLNDLALWQDTVEKSPLKARPRVNLATSLIKIGNYDKALDELSRAVVLKTDYVAAHENMGVAHFHKGAYQLAVIAFGKAIDLDPGKASAHYAMGKAYMGLGEKDKAIQVFEKTLSLHPSHLGARNNLGLILAEKKAYSKAISQFETLLRLDPGHKAASFNLALAYSLSGQADRAIRLYEKVIELEPDFFEAYYNLGLLYLDALNRPDDAKPYLKKALALSKEPETAARIKEIIIRIEQGHPE